MNLKEKKLQEAESRLSILEEKLNYLEFSDEPDKDIKIVDCKHDIEKQKTIIFNTKRHLENVR